MEFHEKGGVKHILIELAEHIPYTIFGVIIGLISMGILTFIVTAIGREELLPEASYDLFHIFHPIHLLLSSTVTTAMFWKHERKIVKAFVIGFIGSVAICGISDIGIPFLSGTLLGVRMRLHICVIEHPQIILPFVILGIAVSYFVPNIVEKSTQYSHGAHVLVSSMASILYLLSFGFTHWIHHIGSVFIIAVVAVMLPCCVSDIVFPLCFTKKLDKLF
ncbi:MAG: hypothetical protein QMD71_00535 [bacterium]|nr:hypothetical protein [bacterium]